MIEFPSAAADRAVLAALAPTTASTSPRVVLLKDNHVAAAGGVTAAISAARSAMTRSGHSVTVEVEVTDPR